MANPVTQIILTAVDLTKAAFASVKNGFTSLREGAESVKSKLELVFLGLSVAGAVEGIKRVVESMDAANKSAQKIGTSVENFSALSYAAGLADIPVQDLEKSLIKLARTLDEAKAGTGPAADAFRRLKIDPKQFSDPADALLVIADRFASMPDGVNKAALALALFGKAGAQMIPLLNAGREGIKAMTDEAAALGVVFSTEAADAAEKFNDNMKKLKTSGEGLGVTVANDIIPGLTQVTEAMVLAAKDGGLLKAAWVGLGGLGSALFTNDMLSNAEKLAKAQEQLATAADGARRAGIGDTGYITQKRAEVAALEAAVAAEKSQEEQRKKSSKDTSTALGENRKAEEEAFKKSTDEQISDAKRLQGALQAAYAASLSAEQDYLRQAKKLRDEANGTKPESGNIESQASAQLDGIAKLMKLQREAGSASLDNVKEQADALRALAGQLDDAAIKQDLIKQANLAEAYALEKAAAAEAELARGLSAQQDESLRKTNNMKAALDGIGKEVSVDIKAGPGLDEAIAKLNMVISLRDNLNNTPLMVGGSGTSAGMADSLRTEALKRGNRR